MRTLYCAVTYICNERCVFCPCSEAGTHNRPSLTYAEVCCAIDEAIAKKQIENVCLSGGEPTLHPDFFNIVKYISDKGLKVSMLTNAIKLSSPEFVEKLGACCDLKNADITIAIHSHIPQKHDELTQHKGSFELSLRGAMNLVEKGVKLSIKNNIINHTYKELPAYVDWVYATFPESVTLLFANIDVNGVALRNKEFVNVHFNKSMPYLQAALDKIVEAREKGCKRNVKIFTTPLCLIDPYYWRFVEQETKELLATYIVPNAEEKNPLLFDVSSDSGPMFKACEECAMKPYCPGTWRTFRYSYDESILKRLSAE